MKTKDPISTFIAHCIAKHSPQKTCVLFAVWALVWERSFIQAYTFLSEEYWFGELFQGSGLLFWVNFPSEGFCPGGKFPTWALAWVRVLFWGACLSFRAFVCGSFSVWGTIWVSDNTLRIFLLGDFFQCGILSCLGFLFCLGELLRLWAFVG